MLDSIGARDVGFGDDVRYDEIAWEQVERGELPQSDALAAAFFHLARIEERDAERDQHGRFCASSSRLDPLDPPLERLRRELGLEPPRWRGARFAVALSHDVDNPWRWTRVGIRGGAARVKNELRRGHLGPAARHTRALLAVPRHRLRATDPYWRFAETLREEKRRGGASTFFVLAGHRDPHDGPSAETYERLRPRLVEEVLAAGGEIGLHGSYTSPDDAAVLAEEKAALDALAGPVQGQRYHYLRGDPHRNLAPLVALGLRYDSTLGFPDALGFRAGIAQPFQPWDFARDAPLDLVEIPLAAMDATLGEERYLGLSAKQAEPRLLALLDWAAAHGGGFSILWHNDRFDPATAAGWDRLYFRLLEAVRERGGICLTAGELAAAYSER